MFRVGREKQKEELRAFSNSRTMRVLARKVVRIWILDVFKVEQTIFDDRLDAVWEKDNH